MEPRDPNDPPDVPRRSLFGTTHWSIVLAARDRDTPQSGEALAMLCAAYWYPLYAFVRRRGHDPDRALDLTQEFFARLLEKECLRSIDPSKGRFRAFLLAACKHFLANEHDRDVAMKRGGDRRPVSIDLRDAEGRYLAEPAHELTAERLFERRWALTVLEQALEELGREFEQSGKSAMFGRMKAVLTGAEGAASYAEIGANLEMTEAAVKKAAQRMRERYCEILRGRIAEMIDDPAQVDDEIRTLFTTLASLK